MGRPLSSAGAAHALPHSPPAEPGPAGRDPAGGGTQREATQPLGAAGDAPLPPASRLRGLWAKRGEDAPRNLARQRMGGPGSPRSAARSRRLVRPRVPPAAAATARWNVLAPPGVKAQDEPWSPAPHPRVAPSRSARDPTFLVPLNRLCTNPDFLRA